MTFLRPGRALRLTCLLLLGLGAASATAAPVFTGDAAADFSEPGVQTFADPAGNDVGGPVSFPAGTIFGWDIDDVRLYYDGVVDTLFVGINFFGIAGDADGDGDPGNTSAVLAGAGGLDVPDLGGTESIALMLDIDEDGLIDVIAGVSAITDTSGFTVSRFAGSPFAPGFAFGSALPGNTGSLFASPSPTAPDFEFTITSFSTLPTSSGSDAAFTFRLAAFAGSFGDAGIAEDFLPGAGITEQAIATPIDVQAVPEPGVLALLVGACLLVPGACSRRAGLPPAA